MTARRRRLRVAIGWTLGLGFVLAACGSPTSPGPSTLPSAPGSITGQTSPATTGSSGTDSGIPAATSSSPATPSTAAGSGSAVQPEPGLFAVIHGSSATLAFQYDAQTTAQVAADPALVHDVSALAIGLYTIPGQQPVADFAIVSVLRLRDPSVGEEWFRQYRDTYDAAACAQAGGVERHSEADFGPNHAFIAGCAGGAFTLHVRLPVRGIVVSITTVGPGRLGQQIAADAVP